MNIVTKKIKAVVSDGGKSITLFPTDIVPEHTKVGPSIDASGIAMKAMEISQHNEGEKNLVKSLGDGTYWIDYKMIQ